MRDVIDDAVWWHDNRGAPDLVQQALCRATKELMFGFVDTVGANHQAIDAALDNGVVHFSHRPPRDDVGGKGGV
jgi:hypothetical protein